MEFEGKNLRIIAELNEFTRRAKINQPDDTKSSTEPNRSIYGNGTPGPTFAGTGTFKEIQKIIELSKG